MKAFDDDYTLDTLRSLTAQRPSVARARTSQRTSHFAFPQGPVRRGATPFIWTSLRGSSGRLEIRNDFLISGLPDEVAPEERKWEETQKCNATT